MAVVEFQNVSKIYSRHASRQFFHRYLWERWRRRKEQFCALRNVSFALEHGESLAVVGPNGAGKTTLLSLICGLSFPEEGRVLVDGKVAGLLELGSGFHPDLTGVENLNVYASLLGLSRRQTRERFDAIVEFAGIGEFIDEPLRTYSSGMVLRLAFSVAVQVDADIMLVDEVLAVGDQNFQAKCFDKILALKREGKVFICASHVSHFIKQLCDRALWLDGGRLIRQGPVEEVLDAYQAHLKVAAHA
ncbi:MAG: ABC transporter ATP-binding protein [Acidobacteriota bacterium]